MRPRHIAATERGLKKIEHRLGIEDIYADLSASWSTTCSRR
ncbi:MAG: hypothetical protein ACLTYW_08805 [Collinsella sp.]